ncbi:hypothetical protein K3495_g10051 [Podosphaera aphanis]|nr:hypothetical protein K3495_g10051 [Podosphaera aphanis]
MELSVNKSKNPEETPEQKQRFSVINDCTHNFRSSGEENATSESSQCINGTTTPMIQFLECKSRHTLDFRPNVFQRTRASASSEKQTGQYDILEYSQFLHPELSPLTSEQRRPFPSEWNQILKRHISNTQSFEDKPSQTKLFSCADDPSELFQNSSLSTQSSYSTPLQRSNFEQIEFQIKREPGVHQFVSKEIDLISTCPFLLVDHKITLGYLLKSNENCLHPLFTLSIDLRWKIYHLCFPNSTKKISLSHDFETKQCYPQGFFESPWSILELMMGAISSFRALRLDLMTYFWTEYEFHVTLSPFTGPAFSLSQVWLVNYFHVVQKLTIEVNTTNFSNVLRMEKLDRMFRQMISSLLNRSYRVPIKKLHLMCRRYIDGATDSNRFIYLSVEDNWSIFDSVLNLHGILQQVRITGLPLEQTIRLLKAIFNVGIFTLPKESPWPNQPLVLKAQIRDSPQDSRLGLSHPQSFSKDFEVNKYRNLTNYSTQSLQVSKASPEERSAREKIRNLQRVGSFHSCTTSPKHQSYDSTCFSPSDFKDADNSTPKNFNSEDSQISDNSSRWKSRVSTEGLRTELKALRAEIDTRSSSFQDLDRINDANERDPAFIRAVSEIKDNLGESSIRPEYRLRKSTFKDKATHTIDMQCIPSARRNSEKKRRKALSLISMFSRSRKKAYC